MAMNDAGPAVNLVVMLTARDPGSLGELRELLATQVGMSRQEPGCERFEVLESELPAGTFIVVERWSSAAALERHRQAQAITTVYVPKILPLVERVLHRCSVLPGT